MRSFLCCLLAALFACTPGASTGPEVASPTSKPAPQPKQDERTATLPQEGYQLRFPPDWQFALKEESFVVSGASFHRQVLLASWGAPEKAWLRVEARDHFTSGEDLVQRDFPRWFEEISQTGKLLSEPEPKMLTGKHAGLRFGFEVEEEGKTFFLERVYLYAPSTSRGYLFTWKTLADERLSFSEQWALILASFSLLDDPEEPSDGESCRKALPDLRKAGRVAKEIACLRLIGIPESGASAWWLSLGSAYERAELIAEALDAYQSALKEADPDAIFRARLARGRILRQKGAYGEAAAEYRAALEASPQSKDAVFGLGLSLHLGGDPKGAIEVYQTWLGKAPEDYEVKESLALVLEDIGAYKDAVRLWKEALAVRRKAPAEGENLTWIEKGEKALKRLEEKAQKRGH